MLDVKYDLARKLKKVFKANFFENLYEQAQKYVTDSAAQFLWQETENLEGLFDEEKLRRFENLVDYAYTCLSLTARTYADLKNWLREERKNMEQDFISKDIFEKTLYT